MRCGKCGKPLPPEAIMCGCGEPARPPRSSDVDARRSALAGLAIAALAFLLLVPTTLLAERMPIGWLLLLGGAVGLLSAGRITKSYWRIYGLETEWEREASAGLGIVPSWVSLLGLASWACIASGVLFLLRICGN